MLLIVDNLNFPDWIPYSSGVQWAYTLAEVNFFLHLYEISKLDTMHLGVWVCFG